MVVVKVKLSKLNPAAANKENGQNGGRGHLVLLHGKSLYNATLRLYY